MSFRVGDGETLEHITFDKAFRSEMKKLHEKYTTNQFIGYIYCESIMILNPWRLWYFNDPEKMGMPKDGTLEVKAIVE